MSRHPFFQLLAALCFYILVRSTTAIPDAYSRCSPSYLQRPALPGSKIEGLTATPVQNFSIAVPQNGANPYNDTNYNGLGFCNVTITYGYLGVAPDFKIQTTVWLPLSNWNGRFQGTGGSGFSTGLGPLGLAPAVAAGYAAAQTNGGHSNTDPDPKGWALNGPGHVDLSRLSSFASTCLNDLAVLSKAIIKSFYGVYPHHSYWNGCSTGGRQGLMLAQRYPTAFDGIAAISPAINWPSLTVSTYWPQQVMNQLQHYPHECELSHITTRAIEACDAADGLEDGIISLPGLCTFDANETRGDIVICGGANRTISSATAAIANAAWSGNSLWYGLNRGTYLGGMANTTCLNASDASCFGVPFEIAPWIPFFVEKDPGFYINNMTDEQYRAVFQKSVLQYQYEIGTADPDLSAFKAAGGKMITTHGLADPAIFPNGTVQYYESVLFFDKQAQDYYRFFEAPGIGHCNSFETESFYPNNTFEALVRWVEEGEAPDTLTGVNQHGNGLTRPLCSFPKQQHYVGGNPDDVQSFQCI